MGSIISIVAKAVENHIKRAGARRQSTRLNMRMPRDGRLNWTTQSPWPLVLRGSGREKRANADPLPLVRPQ